LATRSIHDGQLVSERDDLQVQRRAGANEKAGTSGTAKRRSTP